MAFENKVHFTKFQQNFEQKLDQELLVSTKTKEDLLDQFKDQYSLN